MSQPVGIRVIGPAHAVGAFGNYTKELAIAMYDAGLPVQLVDSTQSGDFRTNIGSAVTEKLEFIKRNQIPNPSVCININAPEKTSQLDNNSVKNIVWTGIDIDDIPVATVLHLSNPRINEIWVPSNEQASIFKKYKTLADKVKVVSFGVNIKEMEEESKLILPRECFYFGAVGSLKQTNGMDVALKAFYEEFANEEDVKLVFKTYAGNIPSDQEKDIAMKHISQFKGQSKAQVLYVVGSHVSSFVNDVIRGVDCIISPARGKHWNNTVIKAMAAGVPVIVSQYGGNRAYTTKDNSIQISNRRVPILSLEWLNQNPSHNSCNWFEPNIIELKQAMRKVYEDRKEKQLVTPLIKAAKARVAKLDWGNVAMQVLSNIRKIGEVDVKK